MSSCFNEIQGIKTIALYINKGVELVRPDPSIENEIHIINHLIGSIVIDDHNEYPKWRRVLDYSGNYKQNYQDIFSFYLHGIENDVPAILETLRNTRCGFICEVITNGNNSYVFPTPIFVSERYTKPINSHSWEVVMSYRVPTFDNYLVKLNTLLMVRSYILVDNNKILGDGTQPIVAEKN